MRHILLLAPFLIPSSLVAQTAEEKAATIKFATWLQTVDGGFAATPPGPDSSVVPVPSLRATSAAVRVIEYLGGKVPYKDRTLAFVKACYSKADGSFADAPGGKGNATLTAIGMMAAAELEKPPHLDDSIKYLTANAKTFEERRLAVAGMEAAKKFAPEIKEWFAEIEKTRNADGTYGKGDGQARDTGGVIAMILRSGGKLTDAHRKAIVSALKVGQRPDGGFGKAGTKTSDGETTYRVMRAFHLLKEKPNDVTKLKAFLGKCRNADGGYGVAPGQPSTAGGTYFAAAIGRWLGE